MYSVEIQNILQLHYHLQFLDHQAIHLSTGSRLLIHLNMSTLLVWEPVYVASLWSILLWVIDYYVYRVLLYEGERCKKVKNSLNMINTPIPSCDYEKSSLLHWVPTMFHGECQNSLARGENFNFTFLVSRVKNWQITEVSSWYLQRRNYMTNMLYRVLPYFDDTSK